MKNRARGSPLPPFFYRKITADVPNGVADPPDDAADPPDATDDRPHAADRPPEHTKTLRIPESSWRLPDPPRATWSLLELPQSLPRASPDHPQSVQNERFLIIGTQIA